MPPPVWFLRSLRVDHSTNSKRPYVPPTGQSDDPWFSTDPASTLLRMSDYEWLVELAAKGLAERDNHLMPKSVTTPEEFYEYMARAALDAIGLHAILELAEALQELKNTDERPNQAVNADAVTKPPEEQSVGPRRVLRAPPVTRIGYEHGVSPPPSRRRPGTRKAENARLRR